MNDSLLIISGDSIHGEVDSTQLNTLNFPFLPPPDTSPFRWLNNTEFILLQNAPIKNRFFTQKSGKPAVINPQPIIEQANDWQVGILIFCFFVISYIRISRKNSFKTLMQGLFSRPMFRQMVREGVLFSGGFIFPVSLVVLLTYSVFISQLIMFFNPTPAINSIPSVQLFLYLFVGVLVLLSTKIISLRVAGIIFKTNELTEEYLSNFYFFHILTTILLLPVLLFSIFDKSSILTYLAILLVALLFIYRILRGILISLAIEKYSAYQNLLYLCTLEILPIFVIIKAVI
jgi:hypothetical protein